jgi:ring-1,2-phenylacetyl-CoA epoxidase subunit PaaB
MNDTQWPLYEVFQQERPDKPHQSVGAVHAPDAEMALLNGRDLYVRRPPCHSLWVAPASAIFSKTAEEMTLDPAWMEDAGDPGPVEIYHVFVKRSQRRSMGFVVHVGQVEAHSPTAAMIKAVDQFGAGSPFVWWVCPDRHIIRSEQSDIDSWFAPALDKDYRLPNQYRTVFTMRQIKRRGTENE